MRDKEDSNVKWYLRWVGAANAGICTSSTTEPLAVIWTTTAHTPSHTESPDGPLLLQHCSSLGHTCRCWEGEEHTLKGN